MNYDQNKLLINLYEKCLSCSISPYAALGESLAGALDLCAVSLWMDHPHIRQAPSRIEFFQGDPELRLTAIDQQVATQVLDSLESVSGSDGSLYYWAGPLKGRQTTCSCVLWSKHPFESRTLTFLEGIIKRLAILVDVIATSTAGGAQRISKELRTTRFIQQQLMPKVDICRAGLSLAYRTLPVHELGGDYIDVFSYQDGSIGFTVADAMGKGVPGAYVMLIARTIFRMIAKEAAFPSAVLNELNTQFISEVAQVDTFVTQFYGVFNPATRKLVYANAGHNQPILLWRKTGKASVLPGTGIAIGGKSGAKYTAYAAELNEGDILIVYSDGLKEIRNDQNQEFGIKGITQTLMRYKEYSADGICDGVVNSVMRYCKAQTDDLSFLILKVV